MTQVKTLDLTKPVQTRDGRKARIICTDALSATYPVVALVMSKDGFEYTSAYTLEGEYHPPNVCDEDIFNIPVEVVTFKNVYFDVNSGETPSIYTPGKPGGLICTLRITRVAGVVTKKEIVA